MVFYSEMGYFSGKSAPYGEKKSLLNKKGHFKVKKVTF